MAKVPRKVVQQSDQTRGNDGVTLLNDPSGQAILASDAEEFELELEPGPEEDKTD